MNKIDLSLLICAHIDTKYSDLISTLTSIFKQKHVPSEIIFIKNGPLSENNFNLIKEFLVEKSNLKLITINKNIGLAKALNKGIRLSKYNYIGRVDPGVKIIKDRFFKQINFLKENKDVSVCGSFANENYYSHKRCIKKPVKHIEIIKNIKFQNPLIHSSVIFNKKDIIKIGYYPIISKCQDYFLWVKCVEKRLKFFNLPIPLIEINLSEDLMKRRSFDYFLSEITIYKYMFNKNMINIFNYTYLISSRFILRIMPNFLKIFIYNLR